MSLLKENGNRVDRPWQHQFYEEKHLACKETYQQNKREPQRQVSHPFVELWYRKQQRPLPELAGSTAAGLVGAKLVCLKQHVGDGVGHSAVG